MKKEFLQFLKEKGALAAYIHNVMTYWGHGAMRCVRDARNYDLLASSFIWAETSQGLQYWQKIADEWHRHISIDKSGCAENCCKDCKFVCYVGTRAHCQKRDRAIEWYWSCSDFEDAPLEH